MRSFEKFLFFYSIVATTTLFISLGLFYPNPLNFISGAILLPVIFYFWIRLTSPEAVGAELWSLRFIIAIAILTALGTAGYRLSQLKPPPPVQKVIVEAPSPTATPAVKSATASGESITDLILGSPTPIALLEITGKAGIKTIDVYQNPSLTSKKVGSLDGTANYLYLDKQNGWYKVVISDSLAGWVSQNQVQEVQ